MIRACPALLLASIETNLAPMFALFHELKIGGQNVDVKCVDHCFPSLGKSLTNLCLTHPEILLEGDPDCIRHVVDTFVKLGIHQSQVHRIIGAAPCVLTLSDETFTQNMLNLSELFSSEDDLVLFISRCPRIVHDSADRFKVDLSYEFCTASLWIVV